MTLFGQSGIAIDDASQVGAMLVSSAHDDMRSIEQFAQALGDQPLNARFLSWCGRACEL